MQRNVSATVVAVVGGSGGLVARLAAPNVRVVVPEPDHPPHERAVAAWTEAARAHRPYVVHDADPLEEVADMWSRLYDRAGVVGDLETAVTAVRAAWQARRVELPDYYLVVDPEGMDPLRRHWYLGVLRDAAPRRVVPVERTPDAVLGTLGRLPAGRWWPALDRLLDGIDRLVPDRVSPPSDEDASEAGPPLIA